MNREQLAHVLRASTQIAGDPDILVIGSQAILGTFDEDELAAPATASREADIAFRTDPDGQKADLVDAAIGELFSRFLADHEGLCAVLSHSANSARVRWNSDDGQANGLDHAPDAAGPCLT